MTSVFDTAATRPQAERFHGLHKRISVVDQQGIDGSVRRTRQTGEGVRPSRPERSATTPPASHEPTQGREASPRERADTSAYVKAGVRHRATRDIDRIVTQAGVDEPVVQPDVEPALDGPAEPGVEPEPAPADSPWFSRQTLVALVLAAYERLFRSDPDPSFSIIA